MIYITGAGGRLGKEVLKLIPGAIPLVRSRKGLKNEIVTDFSEEQLKEILKDAKTIIHLAGSMNFLDPKGVMAANVDLTWRIVKAMPKDARIILASSISVYGKNLEGVTITEDNSLNPDSVYAKSKAEAEAIVEQAKDYVILRIGTIYGKGFDDYYTILKMIKKGAMYIIESGKNHIPFVHVGDVAQAVKNSLKAEKGIYNIVGEEKTQEDILGFAAKELGVDPPVQKVPGSFVMGMAQLEESRALLTKSKPKITREHVLILSSDRVFDCTKAKEKLGFKPKKIEEGIKEMVRDMEQ